MKRKWLGILGFLFVLVLLLAFPLTVQAADFSGITGPTLVKDEYGFWNYIVDGQVCYDNTLVKYNGAWWHVEDGTLGTGNAVVPYNGSVYYAADGRVQFGFSGVVTARHAQTNAFCTCLVKSGVLDKTQTVYKVDGVWLYFDHGIATTDTLLVSYAGARWYVVNGRIDYSEGIVYVDDGEYYVKNGKVQTATTGLVKYNNVWYYVANGKVCYDDTLVQHSGGWWHVVDGRLSDGERLVPFNGRHYYVNNGMVQFGFSGVVNAYSHSTGVYDRFLIKSGSLNTAPTLCKYDDQWRYFKDGTYCYDAAFVPYNGSMWYVANSVLQTEATFAYDYEADEYAYLRNGMVQASFTGLTKYDDQWWYIKDGYICRDATLVQHAGAWWHAHGGVVCYDEEIVPFDGKEYYVKDGMAQLRTTNVVYAWRLSDGYCNDYLIRNGILVTAPTLFKHEDLWKYFENGSHDYSTTLVKYNNCWWAVSDGYLEYEPCVVDYNGRGYYAVDGKVAFNFSGVVDAVYNGYSQLCLIKNGQLDLTTCIAAAGDKEYFFKKGVVSYETTLFKVDGKWKYISYGVVSNSPAIVKYMGTSYYVHDGIAERASTLVNTEGYKGDYAASVAELVNEERVKQGLNELVYDTDLSYAAFVRAIETEELFSHTRPDGASCFTVSELAYGENIAAGYKTPESVMEAWMNSTGHRENILRDFFGSIGVGVYEYAHRLYWVQLFGL